MLSEIGARISILDIVLLVRYTANSTRVNDKSALKLGSVYSIDGRTRIKVTLDCNVIYFQVWVGPMLCQDENLGIGVIATAGTG